MRAILPFSLPWPPAIVMPKRSRISFGTLPPSIDSGSADRGDDVGVLVVAAPSVLEVERAGRLARGAAEQAVALEDLLEPLVLDHPERHVERA